MLLKITWLYVHGLSRVVNPYSFPLFSAANIYGSSLGRLETHKNVNATCTLFIMERIKIA